jgi:hypothetical protein
MNEVEGLRVLAIQSDPPAIGTAQTAELKALVHAPLGEAVTYSWSWCPVLGTAQNGYECLFDEEQLTTALSSLDPAAAALVPSFDLGDEPTARFTLDLPSPVLKLLCENLLGQASASMGLSPSCGETIKSSVILKVEAGGETVTAMKDLGLLLKVEAASMNPQIDSVKARSTKDDEWIDLADPALAVIEAGQRYELEVDVPDSSSETFTPAATDQDPNPEPKRERLFITWFVTAGSTQSMRTTFIDGQVGFDVLRHNEWSISAIDPPTEATLYVVLQDERGGVAWTQRTVAVKE